VGAHWFRPVPLSAGWRAGVLESPVHPFGNGTNLPTTILSLPSH
jgi:hypothetical protein